MVGGQKNTRTTRGWGVMKWYTIYVYIYISYIDGKFRNNDRDLDKIKFWIRIILSINIWTGHLPKWPWIVTTQMTDQNDANTRDLSPGSPETFHIWYILIQFRMKHSLHSQFFYCDITLKYQSLILHFIVNTDAQTSIFEIFRFWSHWGGMGVSIS